MAGTFDPYHIWLGIPPEEQPADHYRLLGVRRFEGNEEVIVNAADQRVRHLRSMQTGKRQAETQKLLNEISAASGILLNPDRRKEYDAQLKAKEAVQLARPTTIQPAPPRTATPIPVAGALPAPLVPMPIVEAHGKGVLAASSPITAPSQLSQIVSPRAHRKSSLTIWIAIGGATCVAIAAAIIGTVALSMMARRTATNSPLVAEKPAKNLGVPVNTRGPQTGEKPPSISSPPNLKQLVEAASSDPPVTGKSSGPPGSGSLVPTKVAVTARDAQKESGKTTARFVRIELPGKAKFLNLAEVQVYSGSENVAVKGNATQSSTGYYGYAKLANDGNTNGQYYDSKSVSCTNLEDNPWWEVDLGAEKVLDKIVVWNRTDGGMDARLQGYKVLALDASRNVIWQVSPPEYPKPRSEFVPSGISGGIPGSTETVQLGKAVDILRDVRAVQGESAQLKDGHLETAALKGRLANMVFDYVPSGEYLLDATITRTSGKDGIILGIMVDGRPCSVDLECFVNEGRGVHSGLELINGQRLISPSFPSTALYKGDVLTNGKPSRVQIFVRKGNVTLQVDGKILLDWKGESAQLARIPVTLAAAGPRLAVGTWESTYTIDSLRVYPIVKDGTGSVATGGPAANEPAKTVEVTDKAGKVWSLKPLEKTDLLADLKRMNLSGSMSARENFKGIVSGGREPDRAEIDFALPAEYIVDTTFTRLSGNDGLVLGFVAGGRPAGLVVDGYANEGTLTGLELLQGMRLNATGRSDVVKGPLLTNGKRANLRVYVKRDALIAELDRRRIVEWTQADGALDRDPNHRSPNLQNFYLGMWQSSYHVESLTVTKVEVAEKSSSEKKVETAKVAVPEEASLVKARAELKAAYGDFEQKGKKPEEKLKLSQEFVSVAASEKGPALRYALLDAARTLAVEGQDLRAAMDVTGVIEESFEGDGLDLQLQTLKLAATATMPPSAWETAAELAGELASAAQEKGRLTLADSAAQLAVDYASHSKSTDFKKSFKQLRDKVAAQLKEWEVVKVAEQMLASKPDDPVANLAVGKWNCLHLGDWDKGIPQLAKSSDAKLAAAAVAERDDKLLPAADAWSLAAEALSGIERVALQRHSLELYQEASEKLTGLEQLKAAKRVNEVNELLAQSASESPGVAGMAPRSKLASDALRPGLLIRVYASQPPKSPTPALGIIHSYGDFAVRKDQLARDLNYPAKRLTFAGIGYIELDKDESLSFRAKNATVFVDGNKVISNNPDSATTTGSKKKSKNPEVVKRTIKKGRHSLQIVPFDSTADGPDVRITRDSGESIISYSPADLDTELGRDILFHGSSAKGKFSLGNR